MKKVETIYIVDDDSLYTLLLKKKIDKLHLCNKIMSFANGENAINQIKQYIETKEELPDIVFLDINMPIMNGWEFMEEFIKLLPLLHKKISIYISSSSIAAEDRMKAQSYEAIENYISKPIENETLLKIAQMSA